MANSLQHCHDFQRNFMAWPVLFFFHRVFSYSKQFLHSIKTGHSKLHLILLYLVSLSFSCQSQTLRLGLLCPSFLRTILPTVRLMHHTQYPGWYGFSSLLPIAHLEWESKPISELQASGLPYLDCFVKQSIHKKFNSAGHYRPLGCLHVFVFFFLESWNLTPKRLA